MLKLINKFDNKNNSIAYDSKSISVSSRTISDSNLRFHEIDKMNINKKLNKISWDVTDFCNSKIDIKKMQNDYGVEYTKYLLDQIMNDDFGTWYLNLKDQNMYVIIKKL